MVGYKLGFAIVLWTTYTYGFGYADTEEILKLLDSLNQENNPVVKLALDEIKSLESNDTVKGQKLVEVGRMYLYGNGSVSGNYTTAFRLFNQSASMGNADGQFYMGVAYASGVWGIPRNEGKAILYYYFSSLGLHLGAMMALGYRHEYSIGVPDSCEAALLYYEIAANHAVKARGEEAVTPILYDQRPTRLSSSKFHKRSRQPKDTEVVDYYHFSAEKGDPDAMLSLAAIYYYGARGVDQDLKLAMKYFKKALDLGASSSALANLGHMYAHGLGTNKDEKLAFKYFQEAAHEGNPAAQNGLGYMYLKGQGIKQNKKKALKLFKSAANQGNAEALYNLGVYNMGTFGDEPDYKAAMHHFHVSAQHSHALAIHKLGQMHMHGIGTQRSCLTAVDLFKNVAERGPWVSELREAAANYRNGNDHAAFVTNIIMAEMGYEVAQENVAWMIHQSAGYTEDDYGEVSVRFYKQAANQGNIQANVQIGDSYYYGRGGLEVNYERAHSYYRQACDAKDAQAMFNLGYMHEHGIGLSQDFFLAKRWYDQAAQTDSEAYFPVLFALWKLKLHMWWKKTSMKLWNMSSKSSQPIDKDADSDSSESLSPGDFVSEKSGLNMLSTGDYTFLDFLTLNGFVSPDTVVIVALSAMLALVIYIRSVRRNVHEHTD